MRQTQAGNSQNRVDLGQQIDYIYERIDPMLVRQLATLNDEAIKITVSALICELVGGLKMVPTKQHKIKIAEALVAQGVCINRVRELTGIGKTTFYRIRNKNEQR